MHLSILCILSLFSISVSLIIIVGRTVSTHTQAAECMWRSRHNFVRLVLSIHLFVGSAHLSNPGLQAWVGSTLNNQESHWPGFVSECISGCHGHSITSHLILFLLVQCFIYLSWHSFFCLVESIDVFQRNDVDSLIFFPPSNSLFLKNLNLKKTWSFFPRYWLFLISYPYFWHSLLGCWLSSLCLDWIHSLVCPLS